MIIVPSVQSGVRIASTEVLKPLAVKSTGFQVDINLCLKIGTEGRSKPRGSYREL
jgi:hypothetical protein